MLRRLTTIIRADESIRTTASAICTGEKEESSGQAALDSKFAVIQHVFQVKLCLYLNLSKLRSEPDLSVLHPQHNDILGEPEVYVPVTCRLLNDQRRLQIAL